MTYMEKSVEELHELLITGAVTPKELLEEALQKSHEIQEKYNAFITIVDQAEAGEVSEHMLSAIPYGAEDLYSTKGILTTGGSEALCDYVPFFNAAAVDRLEEAGAVLAGKTAMDEFGIGTTGTTGYTGEVRNPWDSSRICAGSGAGSACAVAAGVYPFALGTDTGDSIRKPAAYCGIVGYKPTYGMISRHGVFAGVSSMDHCGVFTRSVVDAAIVVDAMKGTDIDDMTTWDTSDVHLRDALTGDLKGKKLCYVKELCDIANYPGADEQLKAHLANFMEKVEMLRAQGVQVDEVSVDRALLEAVPSVYLVIGAAEISSNLGGITGLIFGPRGEGRSWAELMKDYRTKHFGSLTKRKLVVGSYVLQDENQERYFRKAQRARRVIVDTWKELFRSYDAVIQPAGTGPAKHSDSALDPHTEGTEALEDAMLIGSFGGFPSITIPDGFVEGLPVGMNITGRIYEDENLLNIAYGIEGMMDYKGRIAREVK
ncbi:MAG: Asp-tRNA(Asn)/Glu-tRNA(Gln) amidotransferase subunit GatA [Solobacterium sp.]|nr:Asp-tRNA(Asn)/Glu-tRNA(Gln) amidotransferase subunit GatA [Solobacterium sp.]